MILACSGLLATTVTIAKETIAQLKTKTRKIPQSAYKIPNKNNGRRQRQRSKSVFSIEKRRRQTMLGPSTTKLRYSLESIERFLTATKMEA